MHRHDFQIRPVVEAILRHPALYTGPRMVKPPAVYTAGMLRALGRGIDTNAWSWLSSGAGQRLFMPPNVSGWDDERWLDTASFRGRWEIANYATSPYSLTDKHAGSLPAEPTALVDGALPFWGDPSVRSATRAALLAFATRAMDDARASWQKLTYRVLTANALRQLIAVSRPPDLVRTQVLRPATSTPPLTTAARFLPGRYTLWCSLAGHRTRGMSATLVIRKP